MECLFSSEGNRRKRHSAHRNGGRSNPEDIANVAEFFAGELSGFVSAQQLLVSGGATAWAHKKTYVEVS